MCRKHPMNNRKLSNRIYSSFELSQHQMVKIDCSECSFKKQRRCRGWAKQNRKEITSMTSTPKQDRLSRRNTNAIGVYPSVPEGQMLNRREGFRPIEVKGKIKIERIMFGRHKDYVDKMIHN